MVWALVLTLVFASSHADPVPPSKWPPKFWSWMVTSALIDGQGKPFFLKGQHVVFDSENYYACRYDEENLVNNTGAFGSDYCDYKEGRHYSVQDLQKPNPLCASDTTISNTIPFISLPPDFFPKAVHLGIIEVNGRWCDHWYARPVEAQGQQLQIDLFATNDTLQYPCQISVREVDGNFGVTWAFDRFNETIPPQALKCTTARVFCIERDWVCRTKRDAEYNRIGKGLRAACNPKYLDCDSLNPGGAHNQPDTVKDHADWAFNAYFQRWKRDQGEDACNFGGVAELIPPKLEKRAWTLSEKDPINWLSFDLVCAHS